MNDVQQLANLLLNEKQRTIIHAALDHHIKTLKQGRAFIAASVIEEVRDQIAVYDTRVAGDVRDMFLAGVSQQMRDLFGDEDAACDNPNCPVHGGITALPDDDDADGEYAVTAEEIKKWIVSDLPSEDVGVLYNAAEALLKTGFMPYNTSAQQWAADIVQECDDWQVQEILRSCRERINAEIDQLLEAQTNKQADEAMAEALQTDPIEEFFRRDGILFGR